MAPVAAATRTAILLLADSRFPSGSHAHSGGLEAACEAGRVADVTSLAVFLEGRLRTVALVDGALAAAVVTRGPSPPWAALDAEGSARIASPALRATARRLGRQLLRSARAVWPHEVLDSLAGACTADGPLHAVALGAVALAAGLSARDASLLAAYHAVAAPASAATRLLGLDPVAVSAAVARLDLDDVADRAHAIADGPLADLPGLSNTLAELDAQRHSEQEVRLFAS